MSGRWDFLLPLVQPARPRIPAICIARQDSVTTPLPCLGWLLLAIGLAPP